MKKGIFLLLILVSAGNVFSQDPQFSQYYAAPLYLNPGLAGAVNAPRFNLNSRMQWANLPGAYNSYALSGDVMVDNLSSGFGFLIMTDKAGSVNLRNTSVGAVYSAKVQLSKKWVFSPGLMFGYGSRSLDFDKMILGDQILNNGATMDNDVNRMGNQGYFDFSTGMTIYNRIFWAGVSGYHINTPNFSMTDEDSKLPMRFSVHAGMRIPVSSGQSRFRITDIAPSFVYKTQGDFQQLDLGTNIIFNPLLVGLWYRGLPISSASGHDAVIFNLGLNLKHFEVGYSYDFTISDIGPHTGGSHELSVMLRLKGKENDKRRISNDSKILPCPNYGFIWD